MNATFERYLNMIDRYLKPLPTSERVDIVKEIKGSMLEMENENLSTEQILERLGRPKELAKAYLGDLISNGTGFSWNRFLTLCAFYSVVGFSGLFVIPTLAIVAPFFVVSGVALPIVGAIKMMNYVFNLGIPYIQNVGVALYGIAELNPIIEFIIAVIAGVLLYRAGRGSWKLLSSYIKKVSNTKKDLLI